MTNTMADAMSSLLLHCQVLLDFHYGFNSSCAELKWLALLPPKLFCIKLHSMSWTFESAVGCVLGHVGHAGGERWLHRGAQLGGATARCSFSRSDYWFPSGTHSERVWGMARCDWVCSHYGINSGCTFCCTCNLSIMQVHQACRRSNHDFKNHQKAKRSMLAMVW